MPSAVSQISRAFRMREHTQYRILEILPGFLVWMSFVLSVVVSFWEPIWVIGFIILFDLYWFIRAVYILVYLLIAFRRYRLTISVDWSTKVREVAGWDSIYHLVMVPLSKEPYDVLQQSFKAFTESRFPLKNLIVVLACEERFAATTGPYAARIQQEFAGVFGELIVVHHPDNVLGEIAGKGSNIAHAGRIAKVRIDELSIPYDHIIVTTLDVDSVLHKDYFAYLTYTFLNHPNRLHTSYQPLAFFNNNIWQSPALTRIVANSTTFWLMTETVRPDRLFTFSSHSMPFTALVDVDFWQNDIVTEDSRIFLQCFIRYDGDYTVTPLYLPMAMDTVATESLWGTIVNQYKQQRRWAYGVENFPYMVWNFSADRMIPLAKKIKYIWNQLEGVFSWATAPILIFILGWLPINVAVHRGSTLLIVQSAPYILQDLMEMAMVGLVAAAVLSTLIAPPPPKGKGLLWFFPMVLQWILFPVTMVLFGSIPATDAQTRLMLGKYLGFWVTEKTRKV